MKEAIELNPIYISSKIFNFEFSYIPESEYEKISDKDEVEGVKNLLNVLGFF